MSTRGDLNKSSWQLIYDRIFAEQLINSKVFNRYGMEKTIKSKGTSGEIKFKKYPLFTASTSAISEGITPTVTAFTAEDKAVTPLQYGYWNEITDLVDEDNANDEVKVSLENLGEVMSHTLNLITKGVLEASTNEFFANSVGAVTSIITAVSQGDMYKVSSTFHANNVKPVTDYVSGNDTFDTTPIEPAFVGVFHPHNDADFRNMTAFLTTANYPQPQTIMANELGVIGDIRIVRDTDITIDADAGGVAVTNGLRTTTGTDADIYSNIIFGKNAYGRIKLNKSSYETIVKGLGENGDDALNQRMTTGCKCRFGSILLYTEKVMVYYCGATA